ncbi:MAG: hypothetical protein IPK53_03965 [bacterium]|nr:hypothetical protein [bacterium]
MTSFRMIIRLVAVFPHHGNSGGTAKSIGIVRYSMCSGRASFHCTTHLYNGDLRADSIISSLMPLGAEAITFSSLGSQMDVALRFYEQRIRRFHW